MGVSSDEPLAKLSMYLIGNVHRPLALKGKTPLIGVFPSALDALISAVQMIAGAILGTLLSLLCFLIPQSKWLENATEGAWTNFGSGVYFLTHDLMNIFSLTIWENYSKIYPKPPIP